MVEACGALSRSMTAQELRSDESFPFYTMENWEVHASEARKRGGIESFAFLPWLIGPQEVQGFDAYVQNKSAEWQTESIETHKTLNPDLANQSFGISTNPFVYEFPSYQPTTGLPNEKGEQSPILPFWTLSPPSIGSNRIMLVNLYPFYNFLVDDSTSY